MAETDEEYAKRLSRTPGIFGNGDAVTAIFGPNPPLAEESEEEEPVSTQEGEVEEEQEEPESSIEEGEVEEETLTSSIFSEEEDEVEEVKEEPESHRAEDVIKAINLVNTVDEVDTLAKDDERRTVIKAADKRREELTQGEDDE